MRADTASITTPAKPERNLAVTTAIVPVTTAIAQSKKKWKYVWESKKTSKKKRKKNEKKWKKNEKKTKKTRKKLEVFYDFGFFKTWLKIGHFGGLRLGTTKNEKKTKKKTKKQRKKLEVFYVFWIFPKFAKRRAGNHQRRKKTKIKWKKNERNTKKKTKKTRGFLRFWIFQKLAKNRPFWWPPRFSGGGGPGTTKGKTIGKKTKKNMTAKWKKREKNGKTKKTRSFLRVLDFSKMSHFGGLRASLGGGPGTPQNGNFGEPFPTRTSARETLGLPEAPKWNLWETSAILVMILVMFLVISKMIINRINK